MAKKHNKSPTAAESIAELQGRIERTRKEGRYQQALELVKQLHRLQPSTANLELLKDTYFQRAVQLRTQGQSRDAAIVLEVASQLDGKNPVWLTRLAEELARCNDVTRSLALLNRIKQLPPVPGSGPSAQAVASTTEQSVYAHLADASFTDEKNGRAALPPELRSEHDAIVAAFALVEASQDDKALETLNAIGLRSPFLDWKLLIRGLVAYYRNDDDKARDNWQRLDPKRIPVRLAAPFRAAIDTAYRQAQVPATQALLKRQLDWVQGGSLGPQLQALRNGLSNPDSLGQAFRVLENLMPTLRQCAPQVVPRLAKAAYWLILRTGPDEIPRYRRVFGNPPDDPHFDRLMAIGYESGTEAAESHRRWQAFEKEVASQPDRWPGEQGTLARAMIWQRMGDNAASIPTGSQREKIPRFLRDLKVLPEPLVPGAETCFRKALELAPGLLEAHESLFHHLVRLDRVDDALAAGRTLIERFPDHVETLWEMGQLLLAHKEYEDARQVFDQALKHNPLDRRLRRASSMAHQYLARARAEAGRFDEARQHYQAGLTHGEPSDQGSIYCRWASCELKAGQQARADELLEQARARLPGELFVCYHLLVECNRMRLASTLKTKLTRQFNKEIAGTPTPALALGLVEYAASLHRGDVEYHGRKSHSKKIIDYATRIDPGQYTQAQFTRLLGSLVNLEAPSRLLNQLFAFGRRRYPDDPYVYYYDAVHLMGDDPEEMGQHWRIDNLLKNADRCARARPRDEPGINEMLEDIKRRQRLMQVFSPFTRGLMNMMSGMGGLENVDPSRLEEIFGRFGGMGMPGMFEDDEEDDTY